VKSAITDRLVDPVKKWLGLLTLLVSAPLAAATLEGFAWLDADSLMPGPDSGQFIKAGEGISLPFRGQPAQGFSAIITDPSGGFLALTDNGFGTRENSADFLLRIYSLDIDFKTPEGGSGQVRINGFINLSDPGHLLGYPATADLEMYESGLPVDPSIRAGRFLTGADLDPESLQATPDGSFWIGDEFGPFIVQFNPAGELADAPSRLNGLVSETRPVACCAAVAGSRDVTVPVSKGFEGLARAPGGLWLYPLLEGPLPGQPGVLNMYRFDTRKPGFDNRSAHDPSYLYRLDTGATAAGDFILFSESAGLVLERDSGHGDGARHKKVYRVNLQHIDDSGVLVKTRVADLLSIDDPHDLNADGETEFSFSLHTPEGLLVLDRDSLLVINDNNFPFGAGRSQTPATENTEFILINVGNMW